MGCWELTKGKVVPRATTNGWTLTWPINSQRRAVAAVRPLLTTRARMKVVLVQTALAYWGLVAERDKEGERLMNQLPPR